MDRRTEANGAFPRWQKHTKNDLITEAMQALCNETLSCCLHPTVFCSRNRHLDRSFMAHLQFHYQASNSPAGQSHLSHRGTLADAEKKRAALSSAVRVVLPLLGEEWSPVVTQGFLDGRQSVCKCEGKPFGLAVRKKKIIMTKQQDERWFAVTSAGEELSALQECHLLFISWRGFLE